MKICLSFHTERLHDDKTWSQIKWLVELLNKFNIRAVWFSVNPTFFLYKEMGFDEKKWIERLKYLSSHNQKIEQHTTFYFKNKQECNLEPNYIRKRLLEDKKWLENHGHCISGFVSGTWIINNDVINALNELNYKYDCTARMFNLNYLKNNPNQMIINNPIKIGNIWEIPTTAPVKYIFFKSKSNYKIAYLHDYDLNNFIIRNLLKAFIILNSKKQFVTPLELNI